MLRVGEGAEGRSRPYSFTRLIELSCPSRLSHGHTIDRREDAAALLMPGLDSTSSYRTDACITGSRNTHRERGQ